MNKKNAVYMIFSYETFPKTFPYPLLYTEADTDYLCFTDSPCLSSEDWTIYSLPALFPEYYTPYLKGYEHTTEISPNQILIGPLENTHSIVTVPDLFQLYGFSKENFQPTADAEGNYIFKPNPIYTDGPYHGRKYQLTIGIPVSNQIHTIHRCLSHLEKLRVSLNCELLIIDTGSTDGTVAAAREYGARVISFPWCNNMSAARNAGIYHALGEWYLSMDDDEWFESTDSIIQFFVSGEYQKYDFAGYIQRNYTKQDGSQYHDHYTCRMARITPSLHFEGRIHDALIFPGNEVIYYHEDYVHHYGFCHDNVKMLQKKTKRNLELLALDHYEFPYNLRYILQIENEFSTANMPEYAIAYSYVGLSTLKYLPNTDYEEKLFSSHLLIALYHAKDESFFSYSSCCLKKTHYSPKDLACIHFCRFDLAAALHLDTAFIESEMLAYKKNCNLYLSNEQKYGRNSLLELDVCHSKIFQNIYRIHQFYLCIKKRDFTDVQTLINKIELTSLSRASIQKFFQTLFQAPPVFFPAGFEKVSADNIPVLFEELLQAIQAGTLSYQNLPLTLLPEDSPYSRLISLFAGDYSDKNLLYFQQHKADFLQVLAYIQADSCYLSAFEEYLRVYKDYLYILYSPSSLEIPVPLLSTADLSFWYTLQQNFHSALKLNPSLNRGVDLLKGK